MQNQITEGPILKPLLAFFFPILLGTFFQQLYNTVDAIVVGNFVGTAALGAVGGPTAVIINFLVNLFVGLSSGTTVVVAQYYGARQGTALREAVHTSIALALAAGVAITVVGIAISGMVLRLMGTPEDVMGYAITYLQVYFCGSIASFIYNMGASILRAMGDTKRPLFFLVAACMTNIVLDLFFVVVLDLEVFGAALATVLSQVVSALLVAYVLLHPGNVYTVVPKEIRFHKDKLMSIVRIGLPAGIQSNMYTLSNMVLQSCINSFGTVAVASWTAFSKLDAFYWLVSGAFGVSITTFVSQNFGAQKYDRVRKGVRVCLAVTFAVTIVISLVFCAAAPLLLRLFTGVGHPAGRPYHVVHRPLLFHLRMYRDLLRRGPGHWGLPQAHAPHLRGRVRAAGGLGVAGPAPLPGSGDRAGELSPQLVLHLAALYHLLPPGQLAPPGHRQGRSRHRRPHLRPVPLSPSRLRPPLPESGGFFIALCHRSVT